MRRAIAVIIGLGILALIYAHVDVVRLRHVIAGCSPLLLLSAYALIIPLILLCALRLMMLSMAKMQYSDAVHMTLSAGVLNIFLPSKMGDIAKFHYMSRRNIMSSSEAIALVVFEKLIDVAALLTCGVIGLAYHGGTERYYHIATILIVSMLLLAFVSIVCRNVLASVFVCFGRVHPKVRKKMENLKDAWLKVHAAIWASKKHLMGVLMISLIIWFLNLFQIWMFIVSLGVIVPLLASMSMSTMAIIVGMLPVSFAGIGTRDAAFIFFYSGYLDVTIAACIGLMCTVRNFLPGIIGLPFVGKYIGGTRMRNQAVPVS